MLTFVQESRRLVAKALDQHWEDEFWKTAYPSVHGKRDDQKTRSKTRQASQAEIFGLPERQTKTSLLK
jgi:hypothetical protein